MSQVHQSLETELQEDVWVLGGLAAGQARGTARKDEVGNQERHACPPRWTTPLGLGTRRKPG
jgi:hypothetical protein